MATYPKIELHVHLEGTVRPQTLLDIARRNDYALPEDVAELYRFRDFPHFIEVFQRTAGALQTAAAMPQVGLVGLFTGGGSPAANNVGGGSSQVSSNGGGKVLTAAAEQPAPINAKEAAKSRDMSILFILSAIVMLVAGALTSIDRKLKQAR